MNNLVTIIIPCFNQAGYLSATLLSVYNQTYVDWECIIVNDGSTDNSEQIALDWVYRDLRFSYVKQDNKGLSAARNTGLKLVKSEFIQFLDADDYLFPDKLQKQIEIIKSNSKIPSRIVCVSSFFHGTFDKIWYTTKPINASLFSTENYLKELILNWEDKLTIPAHAFLFSSDLFIQNNLFFNEDLINHEDIHCWIRLFMNDPIVLQTDDELVIYRDTLHSMSNQMRLMGQGYIQVLKDLKASRVFDESYIDLLETKYNKVCLAYRRFDLMKLSDKFFYAPQILHYYFQRIVEKIGYAKIKA